MPVAVFFQEKMRISRDPLDPGGRPSASPFGALRNTTPGLSRSRERSIIRRDIQVVLIKAILSSCGAHAGVFRMFTRFYTPFMIAGSRTRGSRVRTDGQKL